MHLSPILATTYCENCGQPVKVAANRSGRIAVCPDCHRLHEEQRKRLRSCWSPGDYHMIHDADGTWSPTGTYLNRKDIDALVACRQIAPGTKFECRGSIYLVTETKLIKIEGNIEQANKEATWHTIGNALNVGRSTG